MTDRMNTEALRRAHAATTPGEWRWNQGHSTCTVVAESLLIARGIATQDAHFIALAHKEVPALIDEIDELRGWVIAFGGPWAVAYAKQHGLPDGSMFAPHYDILQRCGARMVDFTRVELTALGEQS